MDRELKVGDKIQVVNYPALTFGYCYYYLKETEIVDIRHERWADGTTEKYYLKCDSTLPWKESWLKKLGE